jgi:hypothetical protein
MWRFKHKSSFPGPFVAPMEHPACALAQTGSLPAYSASRRAGVQTEFHFYVNFSATDDTGPARQTGPFIWAALQAA